MVQTIMTHNGARVDVHFEDRPIHGNGVAVRTYGELKISHGQIVYAYDLKQKSIQVLQLTAETHNPYFPTKWVSDKGKIPNKATIYIWDATTGDPYVGSVWLNFEAIGPT